MVATVGWRASSSPGWRVGPSRRHRLGATTSRGIGLSMWLGILQVLQVGRTGVAFVPLLEPGSVGSFLSAGRLVPRGDGTGALLRLGLILVRCASSGVLGGGLVVALRPCSRRTVRTLGRGGITSRRPPNVTLQPTSARSSEALRLIGWKCSPQIGEPHIESTACS